MSVPKGSRISVSSWRIPPWTYMCEMKLEQDPSAANMALYMLHRARASTLLLMSARSAEWFTWVECVSR